jgi:hypothetical protein
VPSYVGINSEGLKEIPGHHAPLYPVGFLGTEYRVATRKACERRQLGE